MKRKTRPEKRVLVRWNDELDKQVLLTIQWACAHSGIKIPWEKVAKMMGDKFSEGAIIQHLAKLRLKMEELGIAVPPPLKRGGVATEASSLYANTSKKVKDVPSLNIGMNTPKNIDNATLYGPSPSTPRGKVPKRGDSEEEDDDDMPDLSDDTDEGYSSKKKTRPTRKPRKPKRGTRDDKDLNTTPNESGGSRGNHVQHTIKQESPGPAYATRGIRKDYKQYDDGVSDGLSDDNEDKSMYTDEAAEHISIEHEKSTASTSSRSRATVSPKHASPQASTLRKELAVPHSFANHQSMSELPSLALPNAVDENMASFWRTAANPVPAHVTAPSPMAYGYSMNHANFPYINPASNSTHNSFLPQSSSSRNGSFNSGVPMTPDQNLSNNDNLPTNNIYSWDPDNVSQLWTVEPGMLHISNDSYLQADLGQPVDYPMKEESDMFETKEPDLPNSFTGFYQ